MKLSDAEKQNIVLEYAEGVTLRELADKYGISHTTVKRIVDSPEMLQVLQSVTKKKEQNTADLLSYMEESKGKVITIMGKYLDSLASDDKIEAATLNQLTTALGTLIDKWTYSRDQSDNESKSGVIILQEVMPPNVPPEDGGEEDG